MKNLNLLPTDKPSRLVKIYNDVNRETFTLKLNVEVNDSFKEYVNVYITSNEEIKDVRPYKGKCHLEKENILNKFPDYLTDLSECKLVIMTTDNDLINDGVQAIPDEFLEWLVKNPSCEEVKVVDVRSLGVYGSYCPYKIDVPKEEIEILKEELIDCPKCRTSDFKNCHSVRCPMRKDEIKQETLEEAAEKYSENWEEITGLDYENTVPSEVNKLDFINGAKYQKAQNQIKDIIPALVDFKHECINMPSQCKPDNLLYSFDDIKNALLAGINIYRQSISGMYSNSEVFRNNAIKDYLANIQK
jgi:sugar-specific transcriptional regulator TrmB